MSGGRSEPQPGGGQVLGLAPLEVKSERRETEHKGGQLLSISEDNENRFFVFLVPVFHHPSHFLFETFSFERGGSRGHPV
jgi:hypothetical protein